MKFSVLPFLMTLCDARVKFQMCPDSIEFQNIDQDKFEGMWYQIQRDQWFPFEIGAECVTHNYRQRADGDMDFYYRRYFWYKFFSYSGVGGQLQSCKKDGEPLTFTCQATMNVGVQDVKQAGWNVLSTDYDKYAVLYSCEN